jgi:hypothetical protein
MDRSPYWKSKGFQLVKEFQAFHSRGVNYSYDDRSSLSSSWARWIQSTPSHTISLRPVFKINLPPNLYSPQPSCVHFHFTPHVPHVPPISSSLISLLFKSTNHDAFHYGIISSLLSLSLFDPKVSSSALYSQTLSPHIPFSVCKSKCHSYVKEKQDITTLCKTILVG